LTIIKFLKSELLIKSGPVLVRESPAPILRPPSPEDARRGRGRHFDNRLWRSVGAEIICDRVQAMNAAPSLGCARLPNTPSSVQRPTVALASRSHPGPYGSKGGTYGSHSPYWRGLRALCQAAVDVADLQHLIAQNDLLPIPRRLLRFSLLRV